MSEKDNNVVSLADFAKRKNETTAGGAMSPSREQALQKIAIGLIQEIESRLAYDTKDLRNAARFNVAAMLLAMVVFESAKDVKDVTDEEIGAAVATVANMALQELYKLRSKDSPNKGA